MNPEISTTFIPKKSFDTSPSVQKSMYGGNESILLPVIAGITLAVTLAASLGMYAYNYYLLSSYEGLKKSLTQFKDKFNDEQLGTLLLLDKKIAAGQEVYKNHTAFSPFLVELGEITMPDIAYDSFNIEESKDKTSGASTAMEFQLSGSGTSYKAIAQQSRILGRDPYIKKHIFSGLKLGDSDQVTFSLKIEPNMEALTYAYIKPTSEISSDDILNGGKTINGQEGGVNAVPLEDITIESVNPNDQIINGEVVPGAIQNQNNNTQSTGSGQQGGDAVFDNTKDTTESGKINTVEPQSNQTPSQKTKTLPGVKAQ